MESDGYQEYTNWMDAGIHTYTGGHIGDRRGKPYLALRKNEGKLSEKPSILDLDLPPSRIR